MALTFEWSKLEYLVRAAAIWVNLVELNFNQLQIKWKIYILVPKESTCSKLKFGVNFMTIDWEFMI